MQQSRLLRVHTSSYFSGQFTNRHDFPVHIRVVMAHTDQHGGAAGRLIGRRLGPRAEAYYHGSDRSFPLQWQGTYFSVSHTQEHTAVAFSTSPVGVDLEDHLTRDVALEMSWALSNEERLELLSGVDARLTEIWTAKEASGKVLGTGLGRSPRLLGTHPVPYAPGQRSAQIRLGVSSRKSVMTHGWWRGSTHIRVAWPSSAGDEEIRTASYINRPLAEP